MIRGMGRGLRRKENGGVCPEELEMGIEVEMEHTDDRAEAERIAREHLEETPDYYSRLKSAGFEKAFDRGKLIPKKITVIKKNGKSYQKIVWTKPEGTGEDISKQFSFDFDEVVERFKVPEKEQKALRTALTELEDIGRKYAKKSNVLAVGITRDLLKEGTVTIMNKKAKTAEDIAAVCQVFRNPAFETFRYVFTKGGKVVGHYAVSASLPGVTPIGPTEGKYARGKGGSFFQDIDDRVKSLGADKVWVVHNHPSGDPSPSDQDISATAHLRTFFLDRFGGHVIIDTDKYSAYTPDNGRFTENSIETDNKVMKPEMPHSMLGTTLMRSDIVASHVRSLRFGSGMSSLILLDAQGRVRAITEVGNDTIEEMFTGDVHGKGLREIVQKQGRTVGAHFALLVTDERGGGFNPVGNKDVAKKIMNGAGIIDMFHVKKNRSVIIGTDIVGSSGSKIFSHIKNATGKVVAEEGATLKSLYITEGAGLGKASRLGIRLSKARKGRYHLTPEKRTVVRNGRAFEMIVYVNRDKDEKPIGPGQFDLFSEPVEVSARDKAVALMGNGVVGTLEKDGLMVAWKDRIPEGYTDEYMKTVGKISLGKAKRIYENGMCVVGPFPEEKKEPEKNPKKISKAINNATPETRNAVTEELFGPPESREAAKTPYVYTPEEVTLNPAFGGDVTATDYTKVVAKEVKAFREKDVLTMERPSYIPEIEDDRFRYAGQRVEAVKIDDDRYVLITGRKVGEGRSFAIVSRAVLAATQDYYMKRSKAKYKEDVAMATGRIKERAQKWLETHNADDDSPYAKREREYHEGILSGRIKITKRQHGIKSPRVMGKNKMTYNNSDLIKLFRPDAPRWNVMRETLDDMNYRINDLAIQMEDDMNSHHKGEMTSYGNKGLKSDLYESHGVMVKRQNGDDITDVEVDQVRKAMDDMYGVYGDRSEMAKNYGLKISHSGEVLMHARKYVGIFFPAFKAIGVSAKYGSQQFGFTLSHEFAHFMDHYLGKKTGYAYSSDNPSGTSGRIASTFRRYMSRAQKSDYQNRTCECFARAFEQYFAENRGEGEEYQRTTNTQGNHPTREVFNEKIRPIIDNFFQENDELLKSMRIPVYKIVR